MKSAIGEFTIGSWNEETYQDLEGEAKLTRASVEQEVSGDLTGTGTVEWLMCYRADGSARFVGLQRFDGSIDERTGSFVVDSVGDFDGGEAKGSWAVVAGSGTGDFEEIRGHGNFSAPLGGTPSWSLELTFE
jgi:hypothetical protein